MRYLLLILVLLLTGCQNFSPRQRQEIDNRDGKINGQMDNLSNSVKAELLKLQQNDEIHNSQIDKIQKGMVNLQNNYQNNGVQILSGSGGLLFSFLTIISCLALTLFYRQKMNQSDKASSILAEKILEADDPFLKEEVFKAALYTDVENKIYKLMKD